MFPVVSKETGVIYSRKAKDASMNALSTLVLKRRDDWKLPLVSYKTATTWEECMPPIYTGRKAQVRGYIFYQAFFQRDTAGVDALETEDEEAAADFILENALFARIGVLRVLQLMAMFYHHTPYESFLFLASEDSTEVVEKGFEDGEHTLVDIGMHVTCEDGTLFPLVEMV